MIKKTTLLKTVAALTAGLLLFSCDPTQKEIELSVSDKSVSFETAGGDKTVTITCNDSWTVNSTADWITVSPKSGSGNGSIKITATANTGFEVRSADISVSAGDKSQSIKVNQLSLSPSLLIDPTATEVSFEGGEVILKITSNAPWTLTIPEDVTWLSADKTSGEGSVDVKVTVLENLDRELRTAKITVKETIGGTTKELTITQEMAPLSRRSDSLALVAIYNASKGAEWTKNNWDLTKPIDEWSGVTLANGRVSALKLSTSGVIPAEWTLPEAVGDLTELTDLRINGNKLTGEIPDVVYGLTKLEKLYFQNDNLTGALSPKLAQLTELTELYVDRNANMTGSIPKEIGSLKKLARINISQTGIGGEIPAELGQCDALLQFMAFKTKLSGELPDIWDMPVLQTVMLHTNPGITGNLPASLSKLKPIVNGSTTTNPSIQIYGCNLTGTIPDCFAELPAGTKQVYVQDNKMSGVISLTVQAHPNFASWKYSPQQEGYGLTLEQVNYRQLDSLALVAIYDAAKGATWKSDRVWDLSKPMDDWYGVKLTDGRVSTLNLANGTISESWEIPAAIGDLQELTNLRLVNGKVTGTFPEEIYSLTKLESLYLTNNTLSWSISPKIADLTNLKDLYIDQNTNLTGSLPKELGQLKNLVNINISKTSISGAVPAEMTQCTSLKNFMAFSAKLTSCPDNWDEWPALEIIMIYGNTGLEGPLPESVSRSKTVKTIRFDDCNFTGNIPESYANIPAKQGSSTTQLWLKGNKLSGVVPAAVQAHENWQATKAWKYETNILPQQEGYGLTLE